MSGTDYADSISNYAGGVTIRSGAGDDVIYSSTEEDYTVNNSYGRVTIDAGAGDDSIYSNDPYVSINAGEGDNTVEIDNFSYDVTVRSGSGDDSISSSGDYVLIDVDGGDDTIENFGRYSTIIAGAGNDYIPAVSMTVRYSSGYTETLLARYALIDGGAGNDTLNMQGNYSTIKGGAGNDEIGGGGAYKLIQYANGDGNDTIYNLGDDDTLQLTDGSSYSTAVSGSDVLVTVGSGRLTLIDAASEVINIVMANFNSSTVLNGDAQDNKLYNVGSSVTASGGAGNDFIKNVGSRSVIRAGAGNDTIENGGFGSTVEGGNGNDFIVSGLLIEANGNSTTTFYGNNAVIDAGAGNDTVSLSAEASMNVIQYKSGDGNDVIYGFNEYDTLEITDGSSYSTTKSGSDVIVSVGSGSVRLKNISSTAVHITGTLASNVETIDNSASNTLISGTSGNDYIINTGERVTIQGNAGNDTIEGSDFGEMILFASNHGNDVITNFGENDTLKITAGSIASRAVVGSDYVVTVKGTNYTGTITLKNAADYDFKQSGNFLYIENDDINYIVNGEDNVNVTGTGGRDYIFNTGEHVTIQGNGGNDTMEGSEDYGNMYLFSSADGNNVITNFGENDTLRMTAGKTLTFATVGNDVIVTLAGAKYTGTVTLRDAAALNFKQSGNYLTVESVNLINNSSNNKKVTGTSGRDFITNSGSNVTIEGKGGDDTIEGANFGEMIYFASDGGNDVVTNFGANDSLRITAGNLQSTLVSGNDIIVNVKGVKYAGSIVLGNAASLGGSLKKRGQYLYFDMVNPIVNRRDNYKVTGTDGRDLITNSGSNVTLQGGGGNDTFEGSGHAELYLFSSAHGDNVITNFGDGDSISMTAGQTLSYATIGNDVIVTLKGTSYTGTVKLIDAAGLQLRKSGKILTTDNINVVTRSADRITIIGTAGRDSITSSGERVTIDSKGGNDTITGSDLYGEVYLFASNYGDNIITNFGKNDTIKCMAGNISTVRTVGDDAIVSLKGVNYSGTVTLLGAGNLDFIQNHNTLTAVPYNVMINDRDNFKFEGSNENDSLYNTGANVTIQGNAGNDTIVGSEYGELFLFASNHGNNVVTNFGKNDTLRVTAGSLKSVQTVGTDVIVSMQGVRYSGTVTLQGAADYDFEQNGNDLTVKSTIELTNDSDNVKFTGTKGADYMINSGSNVTINAGFGDERRSGAVSVRRGRRQ